MKTFVRFWAMQMIMVSLVCLFIPRAQAQPYCTLTGLVTDMCTGLPIAGAKVVCNVYMTMTNNSGVYLIGNITGGGTQTVMVSKIGYDSFMGTVTLVPNTTVTFDAALPCAPNPPASVTAVPDDPGNPTSVVVNWTPPQGNYELIYDDGSQEGFSIWAAGGNLHALRFTPLGYPAKISGGSINLGTASNYPPGALPLTSFKMLVSLADGPGGTPGTMVDSIDVTPVGFGWISFSFSTPVNLNSGDFYLVMKQGGPPPHACGIGIDTTTQQLRSWSRFVTSGGPWAPVTGNYMMRAIVSGPGGPVMLDNTAFNPSYQVWRIPQGQLGNPPLWSSIYFGSSTSVVDPGWSTLNCGPYQWMVKAVYPPGQRLSSPTLSNVIGKCWTSHVEIQTVSGCGDCGKNTNISLVNLDYPDTTYLIPLDSLGLGQADGVWKGNYTLFYNQFPCQSSAINLTILNDTTLLTMNVLGLTPPITGLSIDNSTLQATWNYPVLSSDILTETWASGSFLPNQWTVSGGNNWQISGTSGNAPPSAMFSGSPQCLNCSQYLTSKLLNAENASSVMFQYDISLDNATSTEMNTLAVELFNGANWYVVRSYDNLMGNIPWTTEVIEISAFTTGEFRLRFHASGSDSYGINRWNIDNIRVIGRDTTPGPPECLLGYSAGLNNVLSSFVTDTTFQIQPDQVVYGQTYNCCVMAVYTSGYSVSVCDSFTSHYLWPPDSLTVTPMECSALVEWHKPDNSSALSGLVGYQVYKNGMFINYRPHPDSLNFFDYGITPGQYLYSVSAKYDLGAYGFPGQYSLSLPLQDTAAVNVQCGFAMPFTENWEVGGFSFNNWTFTPSQGNWAMGSGDKSTGVCAVFQGTPQCTNYSYALVSDNMDAFNWHCAGIWLDFDYKLVLQNATGNETLSVDVFYDSIWHQVKLLSNAAAASWTAMRLELSGATGKIFRIRFVAAGNNSADIGQWGIDNIKISGVCLPPMALSYTMNGQMADLTWLAPDCNGTTPPAGYNVYRTDSTGIPPYQLRNTGLVTGTAFSDDTGPGSGGEYYYYLTAVFDDPMTTVPLCESATSDTIVVSTVDVPSHGNQGFRVFPNPAGGMIRVQSTSAMNSLEVFDSRNQRLLYFERLNTCHYQLDVSELSAGIYFFRVTGKEMITIIKVMVTH